jgi:adenylate cyclase
VTEQRVQRRLAAILAADVVGYSALMERDEEATYAEFERLKRELIEPSLARHEGRLIKTTGDGAHAEFASPLAAMRCAVEIQDHLATGGSSLRLRVGLNLGDVIVGQDGDLYGDGINIAVRLEGIADPGGILISEKVYDEVEGKLDVAFEDRGEQQLKNISKPVRVYAVRAKAQATVTNSDVPERIPGKLRPSSFLGRVRARLRAVIPALASIAAVGAIAGGLIGYWNVWKTVSTDVFQGGQKTQRETAVRPDLAPRLSLVVLPFANLNNDPEQDYFADAITTDLTTDLAQMPGAFVIGRETAFTYKNKPIDLKTLGKDLGIRWAVQGAVRRNGDQVRVNVSLTDLRTAGDVWSDRFDGDRTNIPVLQDQITARLARSLNIKIIQAESRRSEADRSRSPDAMDFNMRGLAKSFEPFSKVQNEQAKALFDSALRLDPDNVDAMIGKAKCLGNDVNFRWSASVIEDKKQAADLIDRALSKRPGSAIAHWVKGNILLVEHPEEALVEFDAALEINPNFPAAHVSKGVSLIVSGRAREALSPIQLAIRISPRDDFAYLWYWNLCRAHLHLREYNEAIEECRRSLNMNSSQSPAYVYLISAYGATGQIEQARQAIAGLSKIRPITTLRGFRHFTYAYSSNAQYRRELEDVADGLRKAGIPEQ